MPVVINDFEVMPQTTDENQKSAAKKDNGNSDKPEMSDYEIEQMLERRAERAERISAH